MFHGKILFKTLHIPEYPLHAFQYNPCHDFFTDIVGRAYVRVFAVAGTEKIGMLTLAVHCIVIQFFPTVSAVEQSRKHANSSVSGRSAAVFPKLLHKQESCFVNNGRVGVLKYLPFLLRTFQTFLVLKRFACGAKINSVPDIFLP